MQRRAGFWLIMGATAAALLVGAAEYVSFALTVRKLQNRADNTALRMGLRLREGTNVSEAPKRLGRYQRRVEALAPGAAIPTDLGAVHVVLRTDWRSPVFGIARPVSTRAVAAIVADPSESGSRVVSVH